MSTVISEFFTFFLHRKTVVFFIPKNSYNISIIIEENILQRRICHVQYYQKSSYGVPEKLMLQKPLNKITINDLTTDCGISRMAFYYHFRDIYDLVEWACLEESTKALQGKKTYETWQEGLLQIFEAVYENKPFIINAYNAVSREQIENFLFQLTHDLIISVVEEQARSTSLTQEQKSFIADFYKYSFVGIMLDWIRQGMKSDYTDIWKNMCITLHGNITNSIQNFTKHDK